MVRIASKKLSVNLEYLDYLSQLVQAFSTEPHGFIDLRVQDSMVQQGVLTSKGITEFTTMADQGIGIRSIQKFSKVFEAYNLCEDIPSAIKKVVNRAKVLSKSVTEPSTPYSLGYARKGFKRSDPPYTSPHPFEEGFKEFYELLQQYQDHFQNQLKVKFSRETTLTSYVSSDEISYYRKELEWVLLFHVSSHGLDLFEPVAFNGDNFKANFSLIEQTVQKLLKTYQNLSLLKKPRVTKLPLVASPESAWTFIHETIGHGVEADSILAGDSFLAGQLGKKISNELISVIDDPKLTNISSYPFDDEGIKAQGTLLIEDGVLVDLLTDRISAGELDMHPSGNARASSYRHDVQVRQSSLFLEGKDVSQEELFSSHKKLLLLGTTNGAFTDLFTGTFQILHQWGYLVEHGEITHLTPPFAIQGRALEFLQNIELIGKEMHQSYGYCVKGGDKVAIGSISPYVAIKEGHITWL